LQQRQLPAALLHSELAPHRRRQTLRDLERQHIRLLYLSPETLLSPLVWPILCQPNLKINGLILDEAHCLVQWGNTFRPAYRRLGAVRPALLQHKPAGTKMAIAAFTATADPEAQRVIQQVLQLQQPQHFLLNPYRNNLNLAVQIAWTPRGRRQKLFHFIQRRQDQSGLVYVRTRVDSETLADWLNSKGYRTAAYHAGLAPQERRLVEAAWLNSELQFVVCTSAFGMGINAQNGVRWVFHFHAPTLLSEYVQEIGRAGRDGKPADTLMLVSEPTGILDPDDAQRFKFFQDSVRSHHQMVQQIIHTLPERGEVSAIAHDFKHGAVALSLLHSAEQLQWDDPFHYVITSRTVPQFPSQKTAVQQMTRFLTTKECRWQFTLKAFGFAEEAETLGAGCGHCDRCVANQK
jgi:ATP-dependent DNA helicase RecQ